VIKPSGGRGDQDPHRHPFSASHNKQLTTVVGKQTLVDQLIVLSWAEEPSPTATVALGESNGPHVQGACVNEHSSIGEFALVLRVSN
jgi:hypothetical protein